MCKSAKQMQYEGFILERFPWERILTRTGKKSSHQPHRQATLCYACPTNKERNGVNAITFQQHIKATHPKVTVTDEEDPPDHTLMIEASIWTKKKKDTAHNGDGRQRKRKRGANSSSKYRGRQVSQAVHDTIVTHLGDSDILSTDFNTQGAKIDPVLKFTQDVTRCASRMTTFRRGEATGLCARS
eukprot:scaffold26810_cov142-Skeletonema_marinoi.AAC.12